MVNNNNRNMNCHRNHGGGHKGGLHGILMILCCLLPILLIVGLPAIGIKSSSLSFLAFLLCPLMHIGMMFMMRKSGNDEDCHKSDQRNTNIKSEIQDRNLIE